MTDNTGTVKASQNFDAWGRNRNPADWTYTNVPSSGLPWLYRGYTGHEMLPQFALINMNGRLYDPLLGRMLRPDIIIDDGANTQDYNMYSYAKNNPLKYTDPSGWDPDDNDCTTSTDEICDNNGNTIFTSTTEQDASGTTCTQTNYNACGEITSQNIYNSPSNGSGETSTDGVAVNSGPNPTNQGVGGTVSVSSLDGQSYGSIAVTPDAGAQTTANTSVTQYDNNVPTRDQSNIDPIQPLQGTEISSSLSTSALQTLGGDGASIQAAPSSITRDWSQSTSFIGSSTYSMANDLYIGAQGFLGLSAFNHGQISNLGGGVTSMSQRENAIASFAMTLVTMGEGEAIPHGNSLKSLRPTWGYKLYSRETGAFLKNGITSEIDPLDRYSSKFMMDKIMVPIEQFPNRLEAWKWEFWENWIEQGPLNKNMH